MGGGGAVGDCAAAGSGGCWLLHRQAGPAWLVAAAVRLQLHTHQRQQLCNPVAVEYGHSKGAYGLEVLKPVHYLALQALPQVVASHSEGDRLRLCAAAVLIRRCAVESLVQITRLRTATRAVCSLHDALCNRSLSAGPRHNPQLTQRYQCPGWDSQVQAREGRGQVMLQHHKSP